MRHIHSSWEIMPHPPDWYQIQSINMALKPTALSCGFWCIWPEGVASASCGCFSVLFSESVDNPAEGRKCVEYSTHPRRASAANSHHIQYLLTLLLKTNIGNVSFLSYVRTTPNPPRSSLRLHGNTCAQHSMCHWKSDNGRSGKNYQFF